MTTPSLHETTYYKNPELSRDISNYQVAFIKAVSGNDEDSALTALKNLHKTFEMNQSPTPEQSLAHVAVVVADLFNVKAKTTRSSAALPTINQSPDEIMESVMRSGTGSVELTSRAVSSFDQLKAWLD